MHALTGCSGHALQVLVTYCEPGFRAQVNKKARVVLQWPAWTMGWNHAAIATRCSSWNIGKIPTLLLKLVFGELLFLYTTGIFYGMRILMQLLTISILDRLHCIYNGQKNDWMIVSSCQEPTSAHIQCACNGVAVGKQTQRAPQGNTRAVTYSLVYVKMDADWKAKHSQR